MGGSPTADTLAGDGGANRLDGGGGDDTVSFAGSPAGIDTSLAAADDRGRGRCLVEVENVDRLGPKRHARRHGAANGSPAAPVPTPSPPPGATTVVGADGTDSLFGEADDDEISGGAGDDQLDGGTGVNVCDGGAGSNTYAGNCDDGAPVLTSLAIDPDSVDTSGVDQTVDFTLGVNDPPPASMPRASSVTRPRPGRRPELQRPDSTLDTGDAAERHLHGVDHPAALLGPGTWTVDVQLADQSGQPGPLTSAQLAAAGLEHDFQQTGADDTERRSPTRLRPRPPRSIPRTPRRRRSTSTSAPPTISPASTR